MSAKKPVEIKIGWSELEKKLWAAHGDEIRRRRAKIGNFGESSGDGFISSTTSRGRLSSTISIDEKIDHQWDIESSATVAEK